MCRWMNYWGVCRSCCYQPYETSRSSSHLCSSSYSLNVLFVLVQVRIYESSAFSRGVGYYGFCDFSSSFVDNILWIATIVLLYMLYERTKDKMQWLLKSAIEIFSR